MRLYIRAENLPELAGVPRRVVFQVTSDYLRKRAPRDPYYWGSIALFFLFGYLVFLGAGWVGGLFPWPDADSKLALQIGSVIFYILPASLGLTHLWNVRYRHDYAEAVRSFVPRKTEPLLRLPRREANILYLLSALAATFWACCLWFCKVHVPPLPFGSPSWVAELVLWLTMGLIWLGGGGTIYVLIHWRDSSWRRDPKIGGIFAFNFLSAAVALLLGGSLITLHQVWTAR